MRELPTKKQLMRVCILLALFAFDTSNSFSQTLLDSLIAANHYKFCLGKDGLIGAGADFLKSETAPTQFVIIGENHNTDKIPEFTALLFKILHDNYGYNYFATEQDPVMMKEISGGLKYRDMKEVSLAAEKFPYGFTFCTDQEIEMLHDIIVKSDRKNSIWGCDQTFGIYHSLYFTDKKNASLLRQITVAGEQEKERDLANRHYISGGDNTLLMSFIDSLRANTRSRKDLFIYNSILVSDSIYRQFHLKQRYASRYRREQFMKERFVEEYREALKREKQPKVLLKFGNAHTIYGFNKGSNVLSLGTFVENLGIANNSRTLNINTLVLRQDSSFWDLRLYPSSKYLMTFIAHCDTVSSHIIDLRPLRGYFYNGSIVKALPEDIQSDMESLLFGYDLLIFIGNGNSGSYRISRSKSY